MILEEYKSHIYQNWKLAYPIMLSQLSHMLLGITDSIMVGRIGAEALAASALANAIFNVVLLFGVGVSLAITPLVASYKGQNDTFKVAHTLKHGLAVNMLNALILMSFLYFTKELIQYLRQPEEVVVLAIPYLLIITLSLLPVLIFQAFRQFAEGLGDTVTPMVIMLVGVVMNIVLNYFLIYGHAGFSSMGLNGAGWSSLITRTFMAFAIVAYIYKSRAFIAYRAGFAIGNYSGKLFARMLHLGIPIGTQYIFEVFAFDFSAIMMGWLNTKTLAAHQIAINLAALSYMTISGMATAATIRLSNELGKKNIKALYPLFLSILSMGGVLMVVWGSVFILGRSFLPMLYVEDREVIEIASSLIFIAGLFQLSDGIQVICIAALRGLQDVRIPSLFIFMAYWLIGLPLGYWLGFENDYGGEGIWWGLLIGLTVTAIVMFLRVRTRMLHLLKRHVSDRTSE